MANGKKRIMFACGSGICTSTAVRKKVEAMLDENGYKGQYEITQYKISECPAQSVNYDFLVATTRRPQVPLRQRHPLPHRPRHRCPQQGHPGAHGCRVGIQPQRILGELKAGRRVKKCL